MSNPDPLEHLNVAQRKRLATFVGLEIVEQELQQFYLQYQQSGGTASEQEFTREILQLLMQRRRQE